MNKRNQRRHNLLFASLGAAVVILLAFAAWILLFENQARTVVDWLLDRPRTVDFTDYTLTAGWKTDRQAYHALDTALYGALLNLQVTPGRIRDANPPAVTDGGQVSPVERRITVSADYSLTECNLEIARAVRGAGGRIVRAAERVRSGELLLEIALGEKVTHHLYVTRDIDLPRNTGRMAVVIACLDEKQRAVVEKMTESRRPFTFALLPWMSDADEIAKEITGGNHEVVALVPMQPSSFSGSVSRGRSVLSDHAETTNRRIVTDALASLPMATGVLGYPGRKGKGEDDVLVPVFDELGSRGKYYLDYAESTYPNGAPESHDEGPRRLRAWGVLDAEYNPVIISMNLDRASFSALENNRTIVIADARPLTLQVLESQMNHLELRGIEFVRVSDLLDN